MNLLDELEVSEITKRRLFPEYRFQFSAQQLCFFCKCLSDTKDIRGDVAEIGCEYGHTTIFLNNYLDNLIGEKKRYFALDTFSGFSETDISFEVENRSKTRYFYEGFRENRKEWFMKTMDINKAKRVEVIEADINDFNLQGLGHLSFVLLDVDLYRPTKKALPELYEALSPGGILIVDDCDPSNFCWDGAYQAYIEFTKIAGVTPRIIHQKLGLIRKPASTV